MAVSIAQALNQALLDVMEDDPRVLVFGEDVGRLGGVFRITDGLQQKFGTDRCFDTPLAESGIVGTAIGLAMAGWRPVPEIQFDGFAFPAFEQIVSHLAKFTNRSRGTVRVPVTLRIPYGGGIGAIEHHSESPEAYWVHTPGLRVMTPSTPADAYGMLREAIVSDDPVIFLEPKRRYWSKSDVVLPASTPPASRALVRREGRTATVIAYGPTVRIALDAADAAAARGWSLEVIDLRSLAPLDLDTVAASVERTGRAIVVHEAPRTLGIGAEVAARLQEATFYSLEAPVQRVTGFDTPYPPARLEGFWLPDAERVLDAVAHTFTY
ncbi:MAG: alpha-ketoacid dehydrogenase subunit beta [Nitriliruptoraceae bacterium]